MQTPDTTVIGEMTTIEALQRLRGIRADPAILDRQKTDPIYGAIAVSRASGGGWSPGDCLAIGLMPSWAVDHTPGGNGRDWKDPEAVHRAYRKKIDDARKYVAHWKADKRARSLLKRLGELCRV